MPMKNIIVPIIMMFSAINGISQNTKSKYDESSLSYLIKTVILSNRDSGGLVILHLPVNELNNSSSGDTIRYWTILNKYYPGLSKLELRKMVNEAPHFSANATGGKFNLFFLNKDESQVPNFTSLEKKYHYYPICRITNLVYSKDGNTCIAYVHIYQTGTFSVEIKKGNSGKWEWHNVTTDTME
jgi:hypothetical protein